jgi:uracil phosphoribosyltransferase
MKQISCPEGVRALHEAHPLVTIITGEMDACLNEKKFILPGVGDFGDRYFGTV